jgi:hypothetical protein
MHELEAGRRLAKSSSDEWETQAGHIIDFQKS